MNKKKYEQNIDEFKRFENDMFGPLEDIVNQYENFDTIAAHIINYLDKKWIMEDEITRRFHKNFINYCLAHHHFEYIQPEQIALWKWKPELYFPKIKCPVATAYGTRDKNVKFSTSIENIQQLMIKGGNNNFTSFVLKDHDHLLENRKNIPSIQDSSVIQVVDWVIRQ